MVELYLDEHLDEHLEQAAQTLNEEGEMSWWLGGHNTRWSQHTPFHRPFLFSSPPP